MRTGVMKRISTAMERQSGNAGVPDLSTSQKPPTRF
jgi:hypothetical protein